MYKFRMCFFYIKSESDFQDQENEDFLSISQAMEEIVEDSVDCYWLIKSFISQFHTKFGDSVPHLVSDAAFTQQLHMPTSDLLPEFGSQNMVEIFVKL